MILREALEQITARGFLLTVDGICDELYCGMAGIETFKRKDVYKECCERKVKHMCSTMCYPPKLLIELEKEG